MEEGLLPHYYSSESLEEIEEERRLLYVAMTRAKHALHLTHAAARGRWGKLNFVEPSRFLDDLPKEGCELLSPPPRARPRRRGKPPYIVDADGGEPGGRGAASW